MSNCRNVQDNGILQVGVGVGIARPVAPAGATYCGVPQGTQSPTPLHRRVHREHGNVERDDDVAGKERDKDEHCRLEF